MLNLPDCPLSAQPISSVCQPDAPLSASMPPCQPQTETMYVWVAGRLEVGVKTSATQRRTEGLKIQGEGHKRVTRHILDQNTYEHLDLNNTLQRHS